MGIYTDVKNLKAQIAVTEDSDAKVGLYEQLLALLPEPKIRRSDLSPEERAERRAKRLADRAAGIYYRNGRQMTPEEVEKMKASWTPERRERASQAAKGRTISPEARANIKKAAATRKEKAQAAAARLAELEAMLKAGKLVEATNDEPKGRRK